MARKRSRSGYYSTIEYIGPRPRKEKKPNFFGGWVIVAITLGAVFFVAKPLVSEALAAETGATGGDTGELVKRLENSKDFSSKLAAEALRYFGSSVSYDPAYYKIGYPGGDVPPHKGVAADLIVRCYRSLGIDLQEEVHTEMKDHFRLYPQLWGASAPDENIDHRRVPNLQRFFSRNGETLEASRNAVDYKTGDIVVWALSNAETHIAIVVPGPADEGGSTWVVHHPAGGEVVWDDGLFDHQILGHFRYPTE